MPKKLKVCYTSNNLEENDIKFLTKMVEADFEVHAVSLRKTEIKKEFKVNGVYYYEFCRARRFYEKRLHGYNPLWYIAASKFLKKIIAEIKPDILHGGYASISGFISALTHFHPFLLMPWGSDILFDPQTSIAINKLVTYSVRNSDMITCDAERVKKILVDKYKYDPSKIVVFPWGIDLNLFSNSENTSIRGKLGWQDEKIVICTRKHRKIYGIEYLIKAVPRIIREEPSARFLFVGDGPLTNRYKRMVNNLGIVEYVKFIGYVENDILPQYLNASDIYVSSSLSDGTSISLLEAMACGLPAVVTDVEAILEWIEDGYNGLVCQKKSSDSLAKNILILLKDDSLKKKFGKINRGIAEERADWSKNFSKLEKMYSLLVANF